MKANGMTTKPKAGASTIIMMELADMKGHGKTINSAAMAMNLG